MHGVRFWRGHAAIHPDKRLEYASTLQAVPSVRGRRLQKEEDQDGTDHMKSKEDLVALA